MSNFVASATLIVSGLLVGSLIIYASVSDLKKIFRGLK